MESKLQQQLLDSYNLPDGTLTPLDSFANKVWLYKSDDKKVIVKQHKIRSHSEVLAMHKALEKLTDNGLKIPNVLKNTDGESVSIVEDGLYELTEFVEHDPLDYDSYNITTSQLQEVGRLLKLIHVTEPGGLLLGRSEYAKQNGDIHKLISNYQSWRSDNQDSEHKVKLAVIDEFLNRTEQWRGGEIDYPFFSETPVVSHGDISLVNILPANDGLYFVDWDNLGLRPALFEVQRTIGLICGVGKVNGNLEPVSSDRLTPFINGYFGGRPTDQQIAQMLDVVEYTSHFHWLKFTLGQILAGDYRVLDILSDIPDENFYWLQEGAFEEYRKQLGCC